MIVNEICTIVRIDGDGRYFAAGAYPCMWQECEAYEVKQYGAENADKAAVYIPDIHADVKKDDYIFRGEIAGEINAAECLTVTSVTRCDYGSETMRHIKAGAR